MQNQQISQNLIRVHEDLQIRSTQTMGRGYFAKNYIPAQTILISVQQEAFITFQSVIQHEYYGDILQNISDKKLAMSYYIASMEQIPQSSEFYDKKVKLFIDNLPNSFDCLICWEQDQLELLQCQQLKHAVLQQQKSIRKDYQIIEKLINSYPILKPHPTWSNKKQTISQNQQYPKSKSTKPNSLNQQQGSENSWQCSNSNSDEENSYRSERKNNRSVREQKIQNITYKIQAPKISLKTVIYFYAALRSRNFYYSTQNDASSAVGALVPYIDCINHKRDSSCSLEEKGDTFFITASKNILKDEEIFINYGEFSLQDTLKMYGFIDTEEKAENNDRKGIAQLYKKMKEKSSSIGIQQMT